MSEYTVHDEFRKILVTDWDPLGIGDSPRLADEYDSYIPGLLRLVRIGSSVPQIDQYLAGIERELGINCSAEVRQRVAKRLLDVGVSIRRIGIE